MLVSNDITGDLRPDLVVDVGWSATVFSSVDRGFDLSTAIPSGSVIPITPSGAMVLTTLYASPGDVDGDGYADLIITAADSSAVTFDRFELPVGGNLFVFSWPLMGNLDLTLDYSAYLFTDSEVPAYLGTSVAALGDLNDDGFDDFAVGGGIDNYHAYYDDEVEVSRAWVFHGPVAGEHTVESIAQAQIDVGEDSYIKAGANVASAGDQDGDGVTDLLVGSPYFPLESPSGRSSGAVFLFLSPVGDFTIWRDADATVGQTGDPDGMGSLGYSLDGNTDSNGDGQSDLLVGAFTYSGSVPRGGAAFVQHGPLRGPMDIIDTAAILEGTEEWGLAGMHVKALGDIDGDNKDDMLVSGQGEHLELYEGSGTAWILYGGIEGRHEGWKPGDWSVAEIRGSKDGLHFGYSLAGGQDLDGDGWLDFLIGDPYWNEGTVALFWGGPT